ncbi:helix-turn-helix transcriptional regulator [Gorillibacterium massiliense]|uniref:helix-turn-helix transcriptional regulator n=1 Tax=Gorillibacterium massiliense TaxID=1280390 RepID=UPI0004AF091E|nr:LuxR C-terminal-related transcriptional regulator [Gorillibacterium massiliense]
MIELEANLLNDSLLQSLLLERMTELYTCVKLMHEALEMNNKDAFSCELQQFNRILAPIFSRFLTDSLRPSLQPELLGKWAARHFYHILTGEAEPKLTAEPKRQLQDDEPIFKEYGYTLTNRETEVLKLTALGLSNKETARRLVLSEGTVKLHLHRVYSKLQASGRVQAIQRARQLRLIP